MAAVLKNLFFYRTITPVARSNPAQVSQVNRQLDWSAVSTQPLLNDQGGQSDHQTSTDFNQHDSETTTLNRSNSQISDAESQNTKSERAARREATIKDFIGDATLGLSDGLTVPFALTAGLSAMGNIWIVIYGGIAELLAGAISMGLGGYLGAKTDVAIYEQLKQELEQRARDNPDELIQQIAEAFDPFNIPGIYQKISFHFKHDPSQLADFTLKFHRCKEEPDKSKAIKSAATIAGFYFMGGLLPLAPYMFTDSVMTGLWNSFGVMIVILYLFGYMKYALIFGFKGTFRKANWSGFQILGMGVIAAGAAMGLVKLFDYNPDASSVKGPHVG